MPKQKKRAPEPDEPLDYDFNDPEDRATFIAETRARDAKVREFLDAKRNELDMRIPEHLAAFHEAAKGLVPEESLAAIVPMQQPAAIAMPAAAVPAAAVPEAAAAPVAAPMADAPVFAPGEVQLGEPMMSSEQPPQQPAQQQAPADSDPLSPLNVLRAKSDLAAQEDKAKNEALVASQKQQAIKDDNALAEKEQQLAVSQNYEKRLNEINQHFADQLDGQMGRYRQAVDDLRAVNPDPYADRSIGWSIASALFIGLNQLGNGIAGNNAPNQALQMMRDTLNTDLQKKQMELDVKRGGVMREGQLLERMREVWGDEKVALQATKSAMWDHVVNQASRQLASMAPEMRGLEYQKTLANLDAEAQKERQKFADTAAALHQPERVAALKSAAEGGHSTSPEKLYSEFVGHINGQRGTQTPDVTLVKKQTVSANNALGIVSPYKDKNGEYAPAALDKMTKGEYFTFLEEVLKTATGGSPTEGQMHNMLVDTFGSKWAEVKGKSIGSPLGAGLGKFIIKNIQYLNTLQKEHAAYLLENKKGSLRKFRHRFTPELMRRAKEEYPELFDDEEKTPVAGAE